MLVHATDPVVPSGVPPCPALTLACAGCNSISRLQPISTTMADCQTLSNIRDYRGRYQPTGNTVLPRPSPIQTGAGEMAEPSTLTQMAINMANTDFVRRVTPHPQAASPLQQLIAEEQQAKGDPGDDEIEGLDAEVLLNADTLEDSEPVTLDFEGQAETPSSHPPPSRNSHTPPTLQQSPPVSAQPSTSAIDPVQQLVQALLTIGQNTAAPPPNPPTTSQSHVRAPDTFDGSNPKDLRAFLLQCQITFNSYPQQYSTDATKVFFAISYLKKTALEWFKQGILEDDPSLTPAWHNSWTEFAKELRTHFGPANPVGSAEIEL